MNNQRNEYIESCIADFREVQKDNKLVIHYVLDRKGRRCGVIVAALPEGSNKPLMGWSLCNMKKDNFNKYIGIMKALDRLQHGNPMIDDGTFFIPPSIEWDLPYFSERVERYFKTIPAVDVASIEPPLTTG